MMQMQPSLFIRVVWLCFLGLSGINSNIGLNVIFYNPNILIKGNTICWVLLATRA